MRLYHHDRFLGEISDPSVEGMWMNGTIHLTPAAEAYRPFFEFMTDESQGAEDPPFDETLLDPRWWFIEEAGRMRGIEVPAIHDDRVIEWRWR